MSNKARFSLNITRWELALRNHVLLQRLKFLEHRSEKVKGTTVVEQAVLALLLKIEQILQQDPLVSRA